MSRAIVLREHGGPEQLRLEDVEVAAPGPGELLLRQTAIGVNFHDVYVRSGLHRTLALPGVPGIEAVGVVEAVGDGVAGIAPGDRVGYVTRRYGAYAGRRVLPAALAIPLPAALDDAVAATVLLKALTVEMLVRRVHRLEAGEVALVHAAAGGVGRLLTAWASALGATVIATVGSEEKAAIAREAGAAHVILYREADVPASVRELTDGRGADVVYDAVGVDTFEGSLASLATLGHLVFYGQASGPPPPVTMARLAERSLSVSRPMLFDYTEDAGRQAEMAANVFRALADGTLRAAAGRAFPLAEAGAAHALLESRTAEGALILLPGPGDV